MKTFENYEEFYYAIKNLPLEWCPALLFYRNIVANALHCRCKPKILKAQQRYQALSDELTAEELKKLAELLHFDSITFLK